ncbi:hypothetical protein MSAN_01038100 [Mycena sanguinolenta]|uniref:Uncharacterized protein n=1 Tax=Mycena sanguinolenta TaxID=230812 RepID=A0A8H6YS03_9AGAR|nr:hypothetical protein MSAN_01038100 [Mycena sanguinolenta]
MSSFASYIKRRSRVVRRGTIFSSAALGSILEEPIIVSESSAEKKSKKNSLKARRRLGVPNLSSSLDEDERLRLSLEDSGDSRPPIPTFESPNSDESESSGSESGEGSRSGSESPLLPTTPTEDNDFEAELRGQCIIRCKSIKPLVVAKRSVSPSPPVPSSSTPDLWQDDDEYYADHASGFITLSPPLPSAFPSAPILTTDAVPRRQSALVRPSAQLDPTYAPPHRASVRLSRAITIPTRAPPPPPIITSGVASSSGITISVSPNSEPPSRPPPRTPVPTDARLSDDYTAVSMATYESFVASRTPSPSSSSHSGSTSRLAALLSPPPRFPPEGQGIPSDVEDDDEDGAWEECADEYDEVPLSPLKITSSAPALEFEHVDADAENWTQLASPYTGWHPRPRDSQLRLAVEPLLARSRSPSPLYSPSHPLYCTAPVGEAHLPPSPSSCDSVLPLEPQPQTPALRSRWSATTAAASPCFQDGIPDTPALPTTQPQTPALRSRWSASTSAASPFLQQDSAPETPALRSRWSTSTTMTSPATPVLRSRWSSSTLSSVHSAHAATSPKTFSFARRYFPKVKSPSRDAPKSPSPAYPKSPRAHPRPMGSASAAVFRPRKQRKLTVADVKVQHLVVGSPPAEPSILACTSPDIFSSSFSPLTPNSSPSKEVQWAAYPSSPGPVPALYPIGARVPSNSSTSSSALYAAYVTQRSPRRRASNASSASAWSLAHSSASAAPSSRAASSVCGSGSSESGHSECSSSSSGLRRKPIPVEMFLR